MTEMTVANNNQNTPAPVPAHEATREPERYVTPAVDIYEDENGLVLAADLPGLDQDSVSVSVEKDVLTIKGAPRNHEERQYLYREFEPVGYFRQFELGKRIDQGAIKAEYKHGVLRLILPFAEEAKPRQITVQVA